MTAPTTNRGAVGVLASPPTQTRVENLGVFRVDGRRDPVIVAGQTFGDDITLSVRTVGATEYEAIKALLVDQQGTLLLQEPFTNSAGVALQRYLRVTDRSWPLEGVPALPRRVITVQAIEVGRGY